jgi:hypothetical protein
MHTQNQVEVNITEVETKSAKIKERYEKYEKFVDRRYFLY